MTMADKKLERCKKYLRSTLMSNKGGIPAAEVYKHYMDLVGEGIPYAQFNYASLETFLSSIPDVCQICWSGRDLMVVGVADRATEHIEKMVSRQQNAKKGRPRGGSIAPRFSGGGGMFGNSSSRNGGGRPPMYSEPKYRPPPPPVVKKFIPTPLIKKSPPISPRLKINLKPPPVQSEKVYLETVGGQAVYGSRVEGLLQGRQHGLFTSQVEKMYQKKWEQSLPKDWFDMMERGRRVRVTREAGASPMVYPAGTEGGQSGGNSTIESIKPSVTSVTSIPLPTSPEWNITVCSVSSTNQIHLWLDEADFLLKSLHSKMLVHHLKNSDDLRSRLCPVVDDLYSALVGGDHCIRRVRVLDVDRNNNTCRCSMLDYGEEVIVNWSKLVKLEMKFRVLPVQAVKVTLAGVDRNIGNTEVRYVKKYLVGKRLVGVLVGEVDNGIPSLVLFDTSQEEDIMVSEEIIKYMTNPNNNSPNNQTPFIPPPTTPTSISRVYALAAPPVPEVGEYFDLVVSHIVSPHLFYVQSHTTLPAYKSLATQMSSYYANNSFTLSNTDLTPGSFLAMLVSGIWYRAKLIKSLSSSLFCMRLVDTGRLVMGTREKIKPLVKQFGQLPGQALRSRLAFVKVRSIMEGWGEEVVEWFKHVALNKSLVGLVETKLGEDLIFTMYDTSVQDVDTVLNTEMVSMGLAIKK